MELDSLKDIWRDLDQEASHQKDDQQIIRILHKRSQSPIARMKRNLLLELIAVVVLYSLTIWYFLQTSGGGYREIAVILFVVGVLFIFYYSKKNRLLGQMQCVTCEVRSNLQQQLKTLEKYVQFYFVGGTILTPVTYFVTGVIVLLKHADGDFVAEFTRSEEYAIFITIGLLLTVGTYFLNKWYIKKLYGQHIRRLKELLNQMEERDL